MRRALGEIGILFTILYLKLYFVFRTSYYNFNIPHYTLHIPHITLHTSYCTFRTPNFTLHIPHFTLHNLHFTLLTPHYFLHTPNFTLYTLHCMPHTSHCNFHTPYFISSEFEFSSPYSNLSLLISSLFKYNLNFHESLRNTTTNHYRNLDAPTTIRFTKSSCKKQKYYVCSRGKKQPWRNHYNAICKYWIAKYNNTTRNGVGNCSSKIGSRRQNGKKNDFETLKNENKRKITRAKMKKKSADKLLSQPGYNHSNIIYEVEL